MKKNSSLILGITFSLMLGTALSFVPTQKMNSRTMAGVFDEPAKKTALEKVVEFKPSSHIYIQKDKFN